MAKVIGHGEWASELARALGEDPSETRSITLNVAVDKVVSVTIEKFVTDEQAKKVLAIIQKIGWVDESEAT